MKTLIWIAAAGAMVSLAGCGSSADSGAANAAPAAAASAAPVPNYTEHRKGIYYYTGAVSENDQKDGRAVGSVVGFRYKGKDEEGDHVLAPIDTPGLRVTCSDPCKIIHVGDNNQVAYSSDSVIGSAFDDAINGLLEVEKPTKKPAS